jgi:hypothetical protein
MGTTENRVGVGSACAGVLVGLAVSATLLVLGAALSYQFLGLDSNSLMVHGNVVGGWICAALAIGAFFGGRSAAVSARLLVRRDGMLAGLVTWALFVVALLAVVATWIAAAPEVAWRFQPMLGIALWGLTLILGLTFVASLVGGAAGARAEARSIGLTTVHVAKRGFVTTPDAYERDFFASSSLSSTRSTAP